MEGPFRMPDDTVVTDDLAREQAYLENARHELARMREKTLSARASGGDRVSDEFLAMTLQRRAAQLVDDPTTALFFGRPTSPTRSTARSGGTSGGGTSTTSWATRWSSTGGPSSPGRSTGPPARNPMGVRLRRRFGVDRGRLTAYQ